MDFHFRLIIVLLFRAHIQKVLCFSQSLRCEISKLALKEPRILHFLKLVEFYDLTVTREIISDLCWVDWDLNESKWVSFTLRLLKEHVWVLKGCNNLLAFVNLKDFDEECVINFLSCPWLALRSLLCFTASRELVEVLYHSCICTFYACVVLKSKGWYVREHCSKGWVLEVRIVEEELWVLRNHWDHIVAWLMLVYIRGLLNSINLMVFIHRDLKVHWDCLFLHVLVLQSLIKVLNDEISLFRCLFLVLSN